MDDNLLDDYQIQTPATTRNWVYLLRRLGAFLLDAALCLLFFWGLAVMDIYLNYGVIIALSVAYKWLMEAWLGCTLGKFVMNLRLIDPHKKEIITFKGATKRNLLLLILAFIYTLNYGWYALSYDYFPQLLYSYNVDNGYLLRIIFGIFSIAQFVLYLCYALALCSILKSPYTQSWYDQWAKTACVTIRSRGVLI